MTARWFLISEIQGPESTPRTSACPDIGVRLDRSSHPADGGVVHVLRSDKRGEQAPVFAAVGPMQFEVAAHRMATEIGAPIALESLPYQVARVVDPKDADFVNRQVSAEVLARADGVLLVLFSTPWRLEGFQRDNPDIELGSLVAAEG